MWTLSLGVEREVILWGKANFQQGLLAHTWGSQAQREPDPTPACSARSRSSPVRCRSPRRCRAASMGGGGGGGGAGPAQPSPAQPACRKPGIRTERRCCPARLLPPARSPAPVFRKRFPAAICRNRSHLFLLFSSLRRPCRPSLRPPHPAGITLSVGGGPGVHFTWRVPAGFAAPRRRAAAAPGMRGEGDEVGPPRALRRGRRLPAR